MRLKMEPKPLVSAPAANSGKWDNPRRIKVEQEKDRVREGSPSIRLSLGISSGYEKPSHVIKEGKSVFTAAQLQDLHQQFLIFKYIVADFPLPIELIRPIWKSASISLGSANGAIRTQYTNFVGSSPLGFDCRSMMDPEPVRCRRTDGKKWRCSKDVVTDQKYCERHMHRGRGRSRKLVEAAEITSESGTITPTLKSNIAAAKVHFSDVSNTNISVPVNLHLVTPSLKSSGNNSVVKAPTTSSKGSIRGNENTSDASTSTAATVAQTANDINNESNRNVYGNKDTTTIRTTTTTGLWSAAAEKINNSGSNGEFGNGKDARYKHLNSRINIRGSINYRNTGDAGSLVASGFGSSPDSVLQVLGCSSLCLNYRNAAETGLQRCRRTDGKKWRCGGDVVPNHKYCQRHLHRGAKKLAVAAQPVTVAAAPLPPSTCRATNLAIPKKEVGNINLDTNLSISIAASPQQMTNDEKSSTTSGSNAVTITDENGSVSHMLAPSP